MTNKNFWLGMLVIVLVFGMTGVGCAHGDDYGSGGNNDPKTLVITMPATIFAYGANGFMIGVFPVGTTPDQALLQTGIVAGADEDSPGLSYTGTDPIKLTVPLYNINTESKWTGSGKYDLYVIFYGNGGHYYKSSSVNISSVATNIQMSNANEIILP